MTPPKLVLLIAAGVGVALSAGGGGARPGPVGHYALGWGIQEYAGARSSVHAGGNGQFYALAAIQPDRDRAAAFLTNDGGDDVEREASAVLKTLLADAR